MPDGVLFGSTNAHVEIRKKLVEENRLDAVVSMPAGVFRPYAGVSTAVLLFTKGAATERIWFYDMEHDGFSLDDKRQPVAENDIPDVLACWEHRHDSAFHEARIKRLAKLRTAIGPLRESLMEHHAEVHRLKFDEAVATNPDEAYSRRVAAERERQSLLDEIAPLSAEINQIARQFAVDKDTIVANRYDLSASRYASTNTKNSSTRHPPRRLRTCAHWRPLVAMRSSAYRKDARSTMIECELGDVLTSAQPGFASGKNDPAGVLQVRMNNVTIDGTMDWSALRRVPASADKQAKYLLASNDVLFNSTNSPELVGKTALFSERQEPVVFSNHFLRLRPDPSKIDSSYLAWSLNALWRRRTFEHLATQWVNQASVRRDDLLALRLDLPDLDEQRRLTSLLDECDRLRRIRRRTLEIGDSLSSRDVPQPLRRSSRQRESMARDLAW